MRAIHSVVIAVLAPILANCSTHPLVNDVTRATTLEVVQKIRCEAKRAVMKYGERFGDETAIAYEFTFDIDETNNASGNLMWTVPLAAGGWKVTAGGGSDLDRRAQRNFTITDTFGNLRNNTDCSAQALEKNWIYPIAGEIGIYEVVGTFAKLYGIEKPVDTDVFSYHDTIQFVTFLGAGVRPTLDLTAVTDRSLVSFAQANLSAQRSDIHSVVVAISGKPRPATADARRGPSGSRSHGIRPYDAMRANAPVTSNSALTTTLLQTGPDLRQNAIHELDRARTLALQDRVRNQIVGP